MAWAGLAAPIPPVLTGPAHPRTPGHDPERGFSLIELLLTIVLLLLLLGSMVFNFSTLQNGAALNEGSTRFVTMLNYARSQAALTGRTVRLRLEPEAESVDGSGTEGRAFVLEWEPEPLSASGRFQTLPASSWNLDKLNELVAVVALEIPRPLLGRILSARAVASGVALAEAVQGTDLAVDQALNFYPDGSSDTARLILVSRDGEDSRQFEIRWQGLTGTVESAWLADTTEMDASAPPEELRTETAP